MMSAKTPSSDLLPVLGSPFPPTLWSVVLRAKNPASARSQAALATLCQTYWRPVYGYLRKRGKSRPDAEDLTQGFFLHLLQQGNALENVGREKGRFRSFLLSALRNFTVDEWEKARAQKRGGGVPELSLNLDGAEDTFGHDTAAVPDAERLFDRRWAMTVLERVLSRLETEWKTAGREGRFNALRVYLSGEPDPPSYLQLAVELGMSVGAVKVAVLRLRQRFRELLREEIASTVSAQEDVEEERRYLLTVLSESYVRGDV